MTIRYLKSSSPPAPLKLIRQLPNSENCCQCCVAMVTGKPIEFIHSVFGHWRRSDLGEVYRILLKLGTKVEHKRYRAGDYLPYRAILRIKERGPHIGHLIVLWDGKLYDPLGEKAYKNCRLTDYLEIK
jgi:hypothetical protein